MPCIGGVTRKFPCSALTEGDFWFPVKIDTAAMAEIETKIPGIAEQGSHYQRDTKAELHDSQLSKSESKSAELASVAALRFGALFTSKWV